VEGFRERVMLNISFVFGTKVRFKSSLDDYMNKSVISGLETSLLSRIISATD